MVALCFEKLDRLAIALCLREIRDVAWVIVLKVTAWSSILLVVDVEVDVRSLDRCFSDRVRADFFGRRGSCLYDWNVVAQLPCASDNESLR
jgi:hypothetical protein